MNEHAPPQVEGRIAQCRLILSVVALGAVFADPTQPFVSSLIPIDSGHFTIDPWVLLVMGTHLAYSAAVYVAAVRHLVPATRLAHWTLWADVVMGAGIATMTEGTTSPFYAFFAFAVVVAGFRSGLAQAMLVTGASVALYLGMIVVSAPGNLNFYIMRPVYLAIVGYLVGYLGQQRIDLQQEIQQLEAAEQRHRIARDLHDGFAQALAGITLKIEGCRRLLRRGDVEDALAELTELQSNVRREYDELRVYMHDLAGVQPSPPPLGTPSETRFSLRIQVEGPIDLIDHLLQIAREGLSNVRRHAAAESAQIEVSTDAAGVRIRMEDDGVGLQGEDAPWSIVSRVRELGGQIRTDDSLQAGTRLQILLPQC